MRSRLRTKKLCFFFLTQSRSASQSRLTTNYRKTPDGWMYDLNVVMFYAECARVCAAMRWYSSNRNVYTIVPHNSDQLMAHHFVRVCVYRRRLEHATVAHTRTHEQPVRGSTRFMQNCSHGGGKLACKACSRLSTRMPEWKIPQWNCPDNRAFTQRKLSQVVQIHFHRCIQWNICNTKCLNTSERCERHFITRELIKVWTISFDHGVCVRLTVRIYDVQYNMYTVRHKMRFN